MINKLISQILPHMPPQLVWMFSKQYIAGETVEQAIEKSKKLNDINVMTTIDVLGEFITKLEEAEANKREYINVIEKAEAAGVKGNYSLKPTFLGLLLDKEVCYQHIREIVQKASAYDNFIRIDMEDSPCTDMSIDLLRRLKEEFPENVGLVLQACLKRTLADIKALAVLNSPEVPLNLRLCKGVYDELPAIAYKEYETINQHYLEDLEYMLQQKMYPAIATHDKPLVDGALKLLEKYNVAKDRYEFQMLYGVTPRLRASLVDAGHPLRVYVPFGEKWFGYSTRRLQENPAMAGVIIKALFKKG
ncbi:proline dehydrogenase family protein [Desulfotalea psychrophila]|uniref:proline dehydrogenase n=1 Tax=Desulfotalea psychrophila (strain LSv54 / DSM 12343) TaxID=177439 RepID=Q6AKA5_DESPS|nr:proline dehydrogenase family protein [Desulfotalea psychrophila]CAG37221.1 related to proline dehydrogenase [Desulfotalea psychrophila LSv54]